MMNAVETRHLTKTFRNVAAVENLNLEVKHGSVFGFLGPNGAGKTTTMRMLLGFATPTSGEAFVLGERVGATLGDYQKKIGYLPDVPAFYSWMKSWEYLAFSGELAGMHGSQLQQRISYLLDVAGLNGVRTNIGGYSRGMKQRLGLAQALLTRPKIVFMDEPTSALDPIGRKEVLEMISMIAQETTVVLSTHILTDVERVCDTVAILNHGKLIVQESIAALKAKYFTSAIEITVTDKTEQLSQRLQSLDWVSNVQPANTGLRVVVTDLPKAQHQIPHILAEMGLALVSMQNMEITLEDIFVKLVAHDEH